MMIQKYKITIIVTCLASPSSTGCETRWETSKKKSKKLFVSGPFSAHLMSRSGKPYSNENTLRSL